MRATCMQVRDYLFSQADLNLTRSDEASVASNVLYMMELLPPPKAAALAYLDSGGQAPTPPRQATPPLLTPCALHALRDACSVSLREALLASPMPYSKGQKITCRRHRSPLEPLWQQCAESRGRL